MFILKIHYNPLSTESLHTRGPDVGSWNVREFMLLENEWVGQCFSYPNFC